MTDIKQIEVDPITRRVSFKTSAKYVEGIEELVQVVVLSLLNTPGKDPLDIERGAGLPALIGYNITDTNEVFSEAARRITITEREVKERQAGLDISSEAKLKNINLIDILEGDNATEMLVRLEIINELGRIAKVEV